MKKPFRIQTSTIGSWAKCYQVSNGVVELLIVPAIGARTLQYGLPWQKLLWQNQSLTGKSFSYTERLGDATQTAWKNYGGEKIWVAPQGWKNNQQWPGPPDPVLDSGEYHLLSVNDLQQQLHLSFISPSDEGKTGIQIRKNYYLEAETSRVKLITEFENMSRKPITWSIWENMQLNCESESGWNQQIYVTVPTSTGYQILYGDTDNPQWDYLMEQSLVQIHYQNLVGKLGFKQNQGWLAYFNGKTGDTCVLEYAAPFSQQQDFPDGGCSLECWTNGAGVLQGVDWGASGYHYLEAEILSPKQIIQPRTTISYQVEWATCRCTGPVKRVTPAGVVVQTIQRHADRLLGDYGVFGNGILYLKLRNSEHTTWQELGKVSPEQPVHVDIENITPMGEVLFKNSKGNYLLLDSWDE